VKLLAPFALEAEQIRLIEEFDAQAMEKSACSEYAGVKYDRLNWCAVNDSWILAEYSDCAAGR
jgi:hypothetical protein